MGRARRFAWVAGAALGALVAACGSRETGHGAPGEAGEPPPVSGVTLGAATREEIAQTRELAGSVQAASVSQVSSRIMAQVAAVLVSEGTTVKQGDLLATLDGRELQARVRQAESALRQAQAGLQQAQAQRDLAVATHARFAALLEGKAVSRQEYEQVAAQERVAQAAVAQAEGAVAQAVAAVEEAGTWLGFAEVRAPASGRVVERRIDAGSTAVPGAPLFAIEQEGRLRLEVPVDAALAGAVTRGARLAVAVEAAGFRGEVPVTEVVPAADPVSRTFVAKADLPPAPGLRSGQFARVSLPLGSRAAVTVPESALVRRGQLDGVFVAGEGGRLGFRIVQPGRESAPGRREVLAGLAAGERIVVDGADRARDGARVADAGQGAQR